MCIAGFINCQFRGSLCGYSVVNTTAKLSYAFAYVDSGGKGLLLLGVMLKMLNKWTIIII